MDLSRPSEYRFSCSQAQQYAWMEESHPDPVERSDRQDAYYWSEMAFDGIQFCATLPVAKNNVKAIDYYVWAVDDEFQTSRTRPHEISMRQSSSCSYPVIDEDPERISHLVVNATSAKQGDKIKDFEEQGISQFIPAKKR